jgi:hypothetical protein
MRKNTLLATVAALSLFGATGIAAAQGMNQGGAPAAAPKAETSKPETSPAAKEPAAKQPAEKQTNAPAAPGAKPGPAAQDQKAMPKQAQDQKGAPQHAQDKPAANAEPKSAADPNAKADAKGDSKTSTSGSAPAGKAAAAPPPEKRSQIASAIKQEKITETKNVNFNISIGTRVPSSVHFYPLPSRIVEIYPEWSGYQVILVNGRYVVVQPQTYEIVYIIEG